MSTVFCSAIALRPVNSREQGCELPFHTSLLVLEGCLVKTFFDVVAQRKDLFRTNYMQLQSSVNSANLRIKYRICERVCGFYHRPRHRSIGRIPIDPSIKSSRLVSFFFRGEFMITFGHFPSL